MFIKKKILEINIDKYMTDAYQKSRWVLNLVLMSIYVVIPIFIMIYNKDYVVYYFIAAACILLIYMFRFEKMIQYIDKMSYEYIEECVENNYGLDEIKMRLMIGKDTLPLNWIIITVGVNLIAYVSTGACLDNNHGIGLAKNCVGVFGWLYVLANIAMILIPNYIFYSCSYVNYEKIANEKMYKVNICDDGEVVDSYMVHCKRNKF